MDASFLCGDESKSRFARNLDDRLQSQNVSLTLLALRKDKSMRLYSVSDEYISYLRKKFPRVYSNKENRRVHTRKYLGVVIEMETHKYYIPLSSPKDKHDYIMVNGKKKIRKNSLIVMRIVSGTGENKELKGTLQIGTMIPVPDDAIELYDVENEPDQAYKDLVNEEIIYIRKNEKKIMKNTRVLYSKRKVGNENKVVQSCLDFVALEKECDNWKNLNKQKIKVAAQMNA